MTTPYLQEFTRDLDLLHFQKAADSLSELEADPSISNTWNFQYQKARLMLGLDELKKARQTARQALKFSENDAEKEKSLIQIMRAYTLEQKFSQAREIFESIESLYSGQSVSDQALLAKALLGYADGHCEEAKAIAQKLTHSKDTRIVCESWVLLGDLDSNQDAAVSLNAYENALNHLEAIPENWRPIRKALILGSMADVCEGIEDFESALGFYQRANSTFSEVEDPEIFDLAGYKAEIICAEANCLTMTDDFGKALNLLGKSFDSLLKDMPGKREKLFWRGRKFYIEGLCALYQQDDLHGWIHLDHAVSLFQEVLRLGAGNSEYLARAAYYACRCAPDSESFEKMRRQAAVLIKPIVFRDPSFFLHALADLANLQALQESSDHKDAAAIYLDQGLEYAAEALRRSPEDAVAFDLLLTLLFNRMSLCSQSLQSQENASEKCIQIIDSFSANQRLKQALIHSVVDSPLFEDIEKTKPVLTSTLLRSFGCLPFDA